MMKEFIEMVNEKIKNGDLLTIGIEFGKFNSLNSIFPESICADSNIHIKGEWENMILPKNCDIRYDEYEDEYIIKYGDMTLYFS